MKRKALIAICCVLISVAIAGCQLAKESAGVDVSVHKDKLIGVLVTTEHLDLFDFEGYIVDRLRSFRGGTVMMDESAPKYQGRLYATLVPRALPYGEDGEERIYEYVFEDIDGIQFCLQETLQVIEDGNSYIVAMSDPAVCNVLSGIFSYDEGIKESVEGTIYIIPSNGGLPYFVNPVYLSADGRVYVVTGNGIASSNANEGTAYGYTLDETRTTTENGKVKTNSVSIKISFSVMLAPEKIVILQMDSDDIVLSRTAYEPGAVPEIITLETDTAYLIVETHQRDKAGRLVTVREIYDRAVNIIGTFSVRADGVCLKSITRLQ